MAEKLMAAPWKFAYDLTRHIVHKKLVNLHGVPCPDPVRSVAEFTASHPVLVRVPSEGMRMVGETLGRCFSTTSKPGMMLIGSLNSALYEFHESGICVSGFDESNLVVSDKIREVLFHPTESDRIEPPQNHPPGMFVSPGISELPTPGKLKFKDVEFKKGTPAGIQANLLDAHEFITKSLLQPSEIPVPDDIKHLLKLMKSPESATMRYLISQHLSVRRLALRAGFVKRYIPYIRRVLPRVDPAAEATILGELPYLDNWIERAKKNKLLELFFNHRQDKYRADAAGFLDFYYDVCFNAMDWYWSPHLKPDGGYPPGQEGYTWDEHEIVMTVTYPELMPRIQEGLWKTNHLKVEQGRGHHTGY